MTRVYGTAAQHPAARYPDHPAAPVGADAAVRPPYGPASVFGPGVWRTDDSRATPAGV
ncbi:hypothetical protein GCM10010116_13800 [Microbispora rosea subsp. aerata]|nr:hypothetical protein [Microbispora rosea]GGO06927.1 hypothetical protein GCM10010116_13800 [Microbispora rosea subsp. aerata]GIH55013.1 hypothetical protein Mro02_19270 [Microbispora rosea subsp. aerata]GLJ82462.1 hypothetical protein GCM10017588_11870 [Microbispora rosea subsp. aerata]